MDSVLFCVHSVPVGVVLSILLVVVWLWLLTQPNVDWDRAGVFMYAISAVIELLSEPLWVMAQDTGHVSIKVRHLFQLTLFNKDSMLIFVEYTFVSTRTANNNVNY